MTTVTVSPEVLVWAREQVALTQVDAAESIGVPPERLQRFERGVEDPTLSALDSMARVYKRPLAFFFLRQPPEGTELPSDFRLRTVDGAPAALSRHLIIAIRQVKSWQSMIGTLREHDESVLPQGELPNASIDDDTDDVGAAARGLLNITEAQQLVWTSHETALAAWRSAVESLGVLVFALTISRDIARGFSVAGNGGPPTIALARESEQARIFTLLHEFAHLMMRSGAICTEFEDASPRGLVERFCNRVAASTLMPRSLVETWIAREFARVPRTWQSADLIRLASALHVSVPAIAIRLEELELAAPGLYDAWMQRPVPPFVKERTGGGGPSSWPGVRLSERGEGFSRAIFRAWTNRLISTADAARAMSMPPKYVSFIENSLSRKRE